MMNIRFTILLVFALIFFLIPYAIFAQLPPEGYIGIFADELHYNNMYCPFNGDMARIEMWIWCLPSFFGQICAEFMVDYPSNIIQGAITANDDLICVSLGTLAYGISVCYNECQYNWTWSYCQTLWVASHEHTQIKIAEHPQLGVYQFANCEDGYPVETCKIVTNLHVNHYDGW